MAEKKTTVKKTTKTTALNKAISTPVNEKKDSFVMDMYDISGKIVGTKTLPKEIFGKEINTQLMAQAVRVYLANQRRGTVSTKTRGEVSYSTRKIYRQKGTGRARHGGRGAPIFVKGGVAHGPHPRDYSMSFPTKMRRLALFSALTTKLQKQEIKIITGIEAIEPKTKVMSAILKNIGINPLKTNLLLLLPKDLEQVFKAGRNIEGVSIMAVDRVNTYQVLNTKLIIFMQDAIDVLEKTFIKK